MHLSLGSTLRCGKFVIWKAIIILFIFSNCDKILFRFLTIK